MNNRYGNPAALGFGAFAIGVWMNGMIDAGWFGVTMAGSNAFHTVLIFCTVALFIAGIFEFLRARTWYAVFFMAFAALFWAYAHPLAATGAAPDDPTFGAWWWLGWALLAFYLWIAVLKAKAGTAVVLLSLGTWLVLLGNAVAGFTGAPIYMHIAGYIGLITALLSFYASAGAIINEMHGKIVLGGVGTNFQN
jgi:succinate-acetate transporter protein